MFLLVNMMFIFILIFESKGGGETEDINVEEDIFPNDSHEENDASKICCFLYTKFTGVFASKTRRYFSVKWLW